MGSSSADSRQRMPSLVRSVTANWLGYFVMAASGFVMPRLISDEVGTRLLGIWDFAWSLVSYTTLLGMGVTSAVGRYVARYRELGEHDKLNRVMSAAVFVLAIAFALGCGLVAILVWITPNLLQTADANEAALARWLVLILGVQSTVQLPTGLFDGVLTGCHRFDLKNLIRGGAQVVGTVAMVVLVLNGAGLFWLAVASLASEVLTDAINWIACRRLCPEVRFSLLRFDRASLKDVMAFGGKTVLQASARTGTYQTNGLIVSYFLGPIALAIYSRQRALIGFLMTLMNQYGNVFAPVASTLQARDDQQGLRELAIKSARFGNYLALPIVAIFCVSGAEIVNIWMGKNYEAPLVLALLAVGHTLSMSHRGAFRILAGLNRHGRAALAELFAAVASIVIGLVTVGYFQMGLTGAAIAIALAVTFGGGVYPALEICRALQIPIIYYVRKTLAGPIVASLPLIACLMVAKVWFPDSALMQLIAGLGSGALFLLPIYWRFVLPDSVKKRTFKLWDKLRIPAARAS